MVGFVWIFRFFSSSQLGERHANKIKHDIQSKYVVHNYRYNILKVNVGLYYRNDSFNFIIYITYAYLNMNEQ